MKKHFRPTLQWMIRITLDCVRPTQSSVIRIIHRNVDLKCFYSILPKCLFVIIIIHVHAYSFIFHKVVWRCIYSLVRCIIITLLQIVRRVCQWKNFENRSLIGKDMDKSKVPRFFWLTRLYGPPCMYVFNHVWVYVVCVCVCSVAKHWRVCGNVVTKETGTKLRDAEVDIFWCISTVADRKTERQHR